MTVFPVIAISAAAIFSSRRLLPAGAGGSEVQCGDLRRDLSVRLLGERGLEIPRAEARLEVHDGDLPVERSDRRCCGRGGVTLYEDRGGRLVPKEGAQAVDRPGHDGVQFLAVLEDVEIVVRPDAEKGVHLVEHRPVLAGHGHADVQRGRPPEGGDDRCDLDGLRTGSEDEHDSFQGIPRRGD